MSRPWSGAALLGVCLALAAMLGGIGTPAGSRGAQPEGTPIGGPNAAGQEILLQAALEWRGSDPVALQLLRITLEPGGRSPLHAHPGLEFGVIESGRLTVRVTGRAVVLPAGASTGEGSQVLPEGVEVTLAAADRIAYAPGTAMTFRNPGPERTTLLAATVLPAGPEAPPGALYPGGTPTADDVAGVRSEILGEAVTEAVPQGRSAITLERLSLRSGATVPGYAGPVLVAVEEGGLSGAVRAGEAEVPAGTPGATPSVDGRAGFRLSAGKSLFLPRGMAETPPLGGEGVVVLLRLGILALPEEAGTPAATPAATTAAEGRRLGVGTRVEETVAGARLRAAPSLEAEVLAGLEQGGMLVVAGPAEADEAGRVGYLVEDAPIRG